MAQVADDARVAVRHRGRRVEIADGAVNRRELSVTTYQIVLFVHLLALLLATGAAAVIHISEWSLRRARTLSEAGRWGLTIKSTARAFPVAVAALLGSGAYMVSDVWSWSTPWVLASIAGLAAIVVVGDVVNGRHGKEIGKAIGGTLARDGDGPVTEEVTRLVESPVAISASFAPTLLMLGVVFVMSTKPGAAGSAAALLVSVALAAAIGPALSRRPERAPAGVAEA